MDGFVFFRLSYFDYSDLQLFAIFIFEVDFSETYLMTSAENCISEPPNLKFFLDPPTRLVPSALAIMPLVTKNLATALGNAKKISCVTLKYHSNPGKEKET